MANNVLKAGIALTVYNRTCAKADALVDKGADLTKTPAGQETRLRLSAAVGPAGGSDTAAKLYVVVAGARRAVARPSIRKMAD